MQADMARLEREEDMAAFLVQDRCVRTADAWFLERIFGDLAGLG